MYGICSNKFQLQALEEKFKDMSVGEANRDLNEFADFIDKYFSEHFVVWVRDRDKKEPHITVIQGKSVMINDTREVETEAIYKGKNIKRALRKMIDKFD